MSHEHLGLPFPTGHPHLGFPQALELNMPSLEHKLVKKPVSYDPVLAIGTTLFTVTNQNGKLSSPSIYNSAPSPSPSPLMWCKASNCVLQLCPMSPCFLTPHHTWLSLITSHLASSVTFMWLLSLTVLPSDPPLYYTDPLRALVNNMSLEHRHSHSLVYCLDLPHATTSTSARHCWGNFSDMETWPSLSPEAAQSCWKDTSFENRQTWT